MNRADSTPAGNTFFLPALPFLLGGVLLSGWTAISVVAEEPIGRVVVYPAPPGEETSSEYQVSVDGHAVPVYLAKVAPADAARRWRAMDDKKNSANFYDTAAFASFDMQGTVTVTVTVPETVTSAKILPTSAGISAEFHGRSISFTLSSPANLTLEINGEWVRSLHLFANPIETDIPDPDDPNVIFYGPGIHEINRLVVRDGETLYVAGGAILRAGIGPEEEYRVNPETGLRNYTPSIELRGKNISLRGRGIIDASGCPTHARNLVYVNGSDITVSGVILRDSSTWNLPIRQSDRVWVHHLKIIGYRANSDGVDICNSRDVTVEDCFIRTLDDLIVVKTDKGQGEAKRILAQRCVLWNQVAHALSIGAEIRENVTDVLFTDCDVIHDQGREWSMRIFHSDSARVSDVSFEDIRIEEARNLISLWIGKSRWSHDEGFGRIENVFFKDIEAKGDPLRVELVGGDADHHIENVLFQNVILNGKPLTEDQLNTNGFVDNLILQP
ncbi:glycosyl hydrolase family 28 protein [Aporhodopirellula aestuarii]|uniref:Glycosyl hydrolase family 28 protein n=1 Tax=Aporhodopirellula aestuarii TaxID=2950107 RepID=A0ABT0U9A9_9BACT|nr:glycosyl hydrolase family 28 protein [Aporhodopirellula aestuarii]MCM2372941.1 glycosyl hydrolase family 28 protein [Aporhodopirellula aestuarii]